MRTNVLLGLCFLAMVACITCMIRIQFEKNPKKEARGCWCLLAYVFCVVVLLISVVVSSFHK